MQQGLDLLKHYGCVLLVTRLGNGGTSHAEHRGWQPGWATESVEVIHARGYQEPLQGISQDETQDEEPDVRAKSRA